MIVETEPLYDSFALYGSGVTLVSVRDADQHRFFIAGSVLTASVAPFTLAVSVGEDRDALPAIRRGEPWALTVLGEHHAPLVRALTSRSTMRSERLAALADAGAEASAEGPLWLPDGLVTFWCRVRDAVPVNDQVLLTGDVGRGSLPGDSTPLLRWKHAFRGARDLEQRGDA
ncbi:flavin reductase family protein [Microbacterium sp.]|uniref:flavin reductase family protein n=1 Tax=Microbacterium sp. TaxID=51671 RepID=UPI00334213EF